MIRRSRGLAAALLAVALTVASGCSKSGDSSADNDSARLDKVTYVTGFGAVGRDSFIWVARDKGYFKNAGIEVTIQKGAGNIPNLTMLKSNQAQFAALDFSGAEVLAGQGRFTLEHPDEAAAIMNKAEPTAAIPAAVGEIQAMKQYVPPPGGAPIGHLDEQRVARGIAELQNAGLMPAGLTPDKVADFSFVPPT
jgi:ABC-type nitrate/sulfonate/bicarbonate transport system substrate-binding protein